MIGAKINGMIVPIDRVLNNGEIVEILTSSSSRGPSRDWLSIVKTGEARNKIRQWFKREKRADNIVMGKGAVDMELRRLAPKMTETQRTEMVSAIGQRIGFATADDLYNSIGYGEMSVTKLIPKLKDYIASIKAEEEPQPVADEIESISVSVTPPKHLKSNSGIVVDGAEGCAVKFARCCNPLPGDSVVGFITRGYGISIHKHDCPNVIQGRNNPETADRWLSAWWEGDGEGESAHKGVYEALLQIHSVDAVGVLADIANALADMRVSILQINSQKASGGRAIVNLKISCKNVEHYNSIVSRLKSLNNIIDVVRGFS
jgi:GTP pyrophosphokinase